MSSWEENVKQQIGEKKFNEIYNRALSDFVNAIGYESALPYVLRTGAPDEIMMAFTDIMIKLSK